MEPQWQTYQEPSGGRAGQYNNGLGSHPPQLTPKYSGQPQQTQPPLGYTYESYQTPTAAAKAPSMGSHSKSVSMASSPAATPHSRDYVTDADTPMEDADPYNRSKYPTRSSQHIRPSSQYFPNEESSAARKYSPMNVLSPPAPYNASPGKTQSSHGFPSSGTNSSRQSPTRVNNYSSPSQVYQSPPCKGPTNSRLLCDANSSFLEAASRAPRLPPVQSTDMSPERFYPQSATVQLNAAFGQDINPPHPVSQQNTPQKPAAGRGPIPKFKKISSTQELQPRINAQPPYRRANPEGGFISVSADLYRPGTQNNHGLMSFSAAASIDNAPSGNLPDMQPHVQI